MHLHLILILKKLQSIIIQDLNRCSGRALQYQNVFKHNQCINENHYDNFVRGINTLTTLQKNNGMQNATFKHIDRRRRCTWFTPFLGLRPPNCFFSCIILSIRTLHPATSLLPYIHTSISILSALSEKSLHNTRENTLPQYKVTSIKHSPQRSRAYNHSFCSTQRVLFFLYIFIMRILLKM